MYTAPPSGDDEDRDDRTTTDAPGADETSDADASQEETAERTEAEDARETPTLDPTTATTDANWTGSVPADD